MNFFERLKCKAIVKKYMKNIDIIEKKRARSQSALVKAILLQEQPDPEDVKWFNKYTDEIDGIREKMSEIQNKIA